MRYIELGVRVELRVPGLSETGVYGTVVSEGLDFLVRLMAVYIQWDDGTYARHEPWELDLALEDPCRSA